MKALYLRSFSYPVGNPTFSACGISVQLHPYLASRKTCRFPTVVRISRPDSQISAQQMFELFLSERQVTGDLISKTSDMLWKIDFLEDKAKDEKLSERLEKSEGNELKNETGFLKLSQTRQWIAGDNEAPVNKTITIADWKTDGEQRRRIGLLEYEALKRELFLITCGIAAVCSCYSFFVFSPQVALSYAFGAAASCLYLQLLYRYTDNISGEKVPSVFRQKKTKKIGIRTTDIRNALEKSLRGTLLAISSPRLIVPPTLFSVWASLKHYFQDTDLQLAPLILGFFAYKGALIIQIFRENENLSISSAEDEDIF